MEASVEEDVEKGKAMPWMLDDLSSSILENGMKFKAGRAIA